MHTILHDYWRSFALRGVLGILVGALALLQPGLTLEALLLVFGGYVVFDGILTARVGLGGHGKRSRRLVMGEGILRVLLGCCIWLMVALAIPMLGYVLGAAALAVGLLELSIALRMRHFVFAAPAWGFGGVVSVLLGAFLLSRPEVGASIFMLLVGLYATIFGVTMLALSVRLRRIERRLQPALEPDAPLVHPRGV